MYYLKGRSYWKNIYLGITFYIFKLCRSNALPYFYAIDIICSIVKTLKIKKYLTICLNNNLVHKNCTQKIIHKNKTHLYESR